jgi:hypothetical protein
MFKITRGKGFHMKFANDRNISVQWGVGNYCEHRDADQSSALRLEDLQRSVGELGSATAEVMVSGPDVGELGVRGWCSPELVADMIHWTATADLYDDVPFSMMD